MRVNDQAFDISINPTEISVEFAVANGLIYSAEKICYLRVTLYLKLF